MPAGLCQVATDEKHCHPERIGSYFARSGSFPHGQALKEKVSEVFYFSDSTIAISWVLNSAKRLRMWTFNCVKEITTALRWVIGSEEVRPLYHIAGDMNTADMVTRPVEPNAMDMSDKSVWQTGAAWMQAPSENLPSNLASPRPETTSSCSRESCSRTRSWLQKNANCCWNQTRGRLTKAVTWSRHRK